MDINQSFKVVELDSTELVKINGGGEVVDFLNDCGNTIGSYLHGLWDAVAGNPPLVS